MELEFKGKYFLKGKIKCLTGLHIGGTTEGVEIGGLDNPVIKDPLTGEPYIPGSSLKGKLRSHLEWAFGLIEKQEKHRGAYLAHDCRELEKSREENTDKEKWDRAYILGRLFGPASDDTNVRERIGPTRLTVRDAFPTEETKKEWQRRLGEDVYTEIKVENAIDRVTSEANPRSMERVPRGSEFELTMILDVYKENEQKELLRSLLTAMHLLENSYLGGSGSRGYGQICFEDLKLEWRPLEYYRNGGAPKEVKLPGSNPKEILEKFDEISWER